MSGRARSECEKMLVASSKAGRWKEAAVGTMNRAAFGLWTITAAVQGIAGRKKPTVVVALAQANGGWPHPAFWWDTQLVCSTRLSSDAARLVA